MADDEDKVVGYRQQGGKLPFPRPGSGGSRKFSEPRDEDRIARTRGSGGHKHDDLVTGSAIGKTTALIDGRWKVTGQARYGDDVRLPGEHWNYQVWLPSQRDRMPAAPSVCSL